LRKPALLHYR